MIVLVNYNWNIYDNYQTYQLSNHGTSIESLSRTSFDSMQSIEPLSNVYRTTFNPNYTHWVPRNFNLNLLNRDLFVFLFFFFEQIVVEQFNQHSRPKCGNSSYTRIINHVFIYLSCNAAFSILFKAWIIYFHNPFIFHNKIFIFHKFCEKSIKFIDNTIFGVKIYLNYFNSSYCLHTDTVRSIARNVSIQT